MSTNHFDVIRAPLLTEKATDLRDKYNKVCFEVATRANKKQVSDAVEKIFNVKVTDVKIINAKEKPKRLGKSSGMKSGYKKAIVSLKEGDKIEIFERVS